MADLHKEYRLTGGNETAIVFIHGILGSPRQFQYLAETLAPSGFDCIALLLPGHGATAKAFCNTPPYKWAQYVEERLTSIIREHKSVYIVGHSLGGLLCLGFAASTAVDGMVLINTPLFFRLSIKQIAMSIKILLYPAKHDDEYMSVYRQGNSVAGGTILHHLLWIRQFIGLVGIAHRSSGILERIQTDALIVQSTKDESVGRRSASRLMDGLVNAKTDRLDLPDSYHAYFSQKDKRLLIDRITAFINHK